MKRAAVALLLACLSWGTCAHAQVKTLISNGDPSNRIDIVVLGDGYRDYEQSKFDSEASTVINGFLNNAELFSDYRTYFNVRTLFVPSAQTGVSEPGASPPIVRDTAFHASMSPNQMINGDNDAVLNAVDNALPPAQRDLVVVLVNSAIGRASAHGNVFWLPMGPINNRDYAAPITTYLHELGHTLGLLGDEYVDATSRDPADCPSLPEPTAVNVTRKTSRNEIKWAQWIDAGTAIPTGGTANGVAGLYLGGAYCANYIYRPTYNSRMRTSTRPYEQVNLEQMVRRLYNYVDPIDSFSPSNQVLSANEGESITFSVTPLQPTQHSLQINWSVDGVSTSYLPTLVFDTRGYLGGTHTIVATVRDTTSRVRSDPDGLLVKTVTWTLTVHGAVFRINAGGPDFVDSQGHFWDGNTSWPIGVALDWGNVATAGTSDPGLYRTERYDPPGGPELEYGFTVPNKGLYQVTLHFAEHWVNGPDQRLFSVQAENDLPIQDLDVYALAGRDAALVRKFNVEVDDGQLNLRFLHHLENPFVNAIEVDFVNYVPHYTLGGTISGLKQPGLWLGNESGSGTVSPSAGATGFTFPDTHATGESFDIVILQQPIGQTCMVFGGYGTVGTTDVTNITVFCADNHAISGTINGLTGSGLVLSSYGGTGSHLINLAAGASGFTSPDTFTTGSYYSFYVQSQPNGQSCSISDDHGTVGSTDITSVVVNCVNVYAVGGIVSGLTRSGLLLAGIDPACGPNIRCLRTLAVAAGATSFTFPVQFTSGSGYSIYIQTQPTGQTCSIANGSGVVDSSNVTNIAVTCFNNGGDVTPPTVPTGLSGTAINGITVSLSWSPSSDAESGVAGYNIYRDGMFVGSVIGTSFTDTSAQPNTTYAYAVSATDNASPANESAASGAVTVTTPASGTALYRIHAGGAALVDSQGNSWSADSYFNTGNTLNWGNVAISGTTDPALYRTERYDPAADPELQYELPVPNGTYQVRLYFSEHWVNGPGQRVFSVQAEGVTPITNLDIFASVGANAALVRTFNVTVADGSLSLRFVHGAENPAVNAIEVLSIGAGSDVTPPSVPAGLTAAALNAISVALSWNASTDAGSGVAGYKIYRNGNFIGSTVATSFTDTSAQPNTTYAYAVSATDNASPANESAASGAVTVTTPASGTALYRIHAGGAALVDSQGNSWSADSYFNTGNTLNWGNVAISGTTDPALYRTERYDPAADPELQYELPIPNGTYQVRLYFSEHWVNGPGQRVFSVQAEGVTPITNLDIFASVGANAALVRTFNVTVADGSLSLRFVHGAENPAVNAIEVLSIGAGSDVTPPSVPAGLTATALDGSTVALSWSPSTDVGSGVAGYRIYRDGNLVGSVIGTSFTDTSAQPNTTYAYAVSATDNASPANESAASGAVTVTTPASGTALYRIHAGGAALVDSQGNSWSADSYFNTGNTLNWGNVAISGTTDPALYRTERYDPAADPELQYELPIPNGTYQVRLYFSEHWVNGPGQRVFSVQAEGVTPITNLDIFASVGANAALVRTFNVTVADGSLSLRFVHGAENPAVNAIEVLSEELPPL